jgi:hypothetical protein
MSIATVVTRGYGSFGSIALVVLAGYSPSTVEATGSAFMRAGTTYVDGVPLGTTFIDGATNATTFIDGVAIATTYIDGATSGSTYIDGTGLGGTT